MTNLSNGNVSFEQKIVKSQRFSRILALKWGVYLGGFTEINRGERENRGEKSGGILGGIPSPQPKPGNTFGMVLS